MLFPLFKPGRRRQGYPVFFPKVPLSAQAADRLIKEPAFEHRRAERPGAPLSKGFHSSAEQQAGLHSPSGPGQPARLLGLSRPEAEGEHGRWADGEQGKQRYQGLLQLDAGWAVDRFLSSTTPTTKYLTTPTREPFTVYTLYSWQT